MIDELLTPNRREGRARLSSETLDHFQQVGSVFYHRIETKSVAPGYDKAETDKSRRFLQLIRTRKKYLDRSLQPVPLHVSAVTAKIKRIRRSTGTGFTADGIPSPAATPTRPARGSSLSPGPVPGSISKESSVDSVSPPSTSIDGDATLNFVMVDGIFQVQEADTSQSLFSCIDVQTYLKDMEMMNAMVMDGPSKSIAFRRTEFLEKKFELHQSLNSPLETIEQQAVSHRDFYNCRKVDTHVHLSSCMNQKHLLRFIKKKIKKHSDDVVLEKDGEALTLREVFVRLNMTSYDLSIDSLGLHAGNACFHRFDRFNTKYNPLGQSELRAIFLKVDNRLSGRYYAEVCKEVFDDLEESKYQQAEYRVSIYGRAPDEWAKLARWFTQFEMASKHVVWLIQTPRIFHVFKKFGKVVSFSEMIDNFFRPLFEATQAPEKHPEVAAFLEHVVGFDSVDDESKPELSRHDLSSPTPENWTSAENPPYSYYVYYWYANMSVLNQFRRRRRLNTFVLRPHAGEAGPSSHLMSTFLLAQGIAHGIRLRKAPVLHYLYYLAQVPVAMSPLSNNALFLEYARNPFHKFFKEGLNVSLSTDDPLQFHLSKEPLIEEYSIATQVFKLTPTDQAELCANSVRMSGFSDATKQKWIGHDWHLPGPRGNDIKQTNLPNVRVAYRFETLLSELELLLEHSSPGA